MPATNHPIETLLSCPSCDCKLFSAPAVNPIHSRGVSPCPPPEEINGPRPVRNTQNAAPNQFAIQEANMASPILIQQLSADVGQLEDRLSQARTSAKSLLVLKEPALVLAALDDLGEALRAIHENALRGRVRVNLAVNELGGGR
jgi:hypothetical protein